MKIWWWPSKQHTSAHVIPKLSWRRKISEKIITSLLFSLLSALFLQQKNGWILFLFFFLFLLYYKKLNIGRHFILLTNTFLKQSINIVDIRAILKVIILWIKEKMLHNFCIMVFTLNSRDLNCFYSVIFPLDKWLMLTGMP